MQAAGYLISPTAEFSASMQNRKDDLNCRNSSLLLNPYRNSTTIIHNSDGIILVNGYLNILAISGQSLIYRIVYNLVYQVMKTCRRSAANIHARPFPDCLKPLQNLNLVCSVFCTHIVSS